MTNQDTLTGRSSSLGEMYVHARQQINALTEQGCAWPSVEAVDAVWAGSPRAADMLASLAKGLADDVPFNDQRTAVHGRIWSQPVAHRLLRYLMTRICMCGLYTTHPLVTQAAQATK